MADETLFGRGRGDRDEDAPDVDRVFSRAVERQLEEQRELNRLVQETTDRLSALDAGLRSLREQTATNLTGLRAEVQEHTTRLGETLTDRIQQVAAEVDRLRSTSTDHQVRLVQLAEAAESAISALEARHVRLTDELSDVSERLHQPPDADPLIAALDRFEVSLASRFDDRFGALSHRMGRLQEQLRAEDAADEVDLGEELRGVQARIDAVRDEAREASRRAAEREAEQREAEQQRLAERLRDELRHEVVGALGPLLEQQRPSTETLEEVVEQALARRSGAVDDALDRLATLVRARAEAIDDRIDAAADRLATRAAEGEQTSAADRAALREELDGRLSPLDEIRDRLSGIDALHRRLDVLEQLRDRIEALGDVPARLERLGAVPDRLVALEDRLERLGAVPDRLVALEDRLERLGAVPDRLVALEDRLELLDDHLGAQTRALAPLTDALDALEEQLTVLRSASVGDEEALEGLRAELSEVVGVRLSEIRDAVGEHRGAVDRGLRATREAVGEHQASVARHLRADRAELQERVGALLEAVESRLDDLDRVLGTSLPEALAQQREELAATLSEPLTAATERLLAAREELRGIAAELGGLPGDVDAHVARGLERATTAARDEARAATERVGEAVGLLDVVQERLDGLEHALVAYLEARDARLEEERMQVLRDLVEDFAEGLSRRDRRRLARRLDDVRARIGLAPAETDAPGADGTPDTPRDGGDDGPLGLLTALLGDAQPAPETGSVPTPEPVDHEAGSAPVVHEPGPAPGPAADDEDVHRCPECGFVAGNAGGLASHRRTHT